MAQVQNTAGLKMHGNHGMRVHDPSTIVKCKDEYWVFATGPGIVSWHSSDLVNWTNGPRVFDSPPAWTTNTIHGNRGYFWAPDIIHLKNRYLLYYSVSTFGKNTSAIGLAVNPTLDPNDPAFHWSDGGLVVQSVATDNFNTIDPTVTQDLAGNLWLGFGSYWSGIKLTQLSPEKGKLLASGSPMYSLARHSSIEASCVYPHGGKYYLFVNWGTCCKGTNSTYNIRVGRSDKITGPYLDAKGVDLLDDGGTLLLDKSGPFFGPGHAGILSDNGNDWFSCHYYDGNHNGMSSLALFPLRWTTNGWPEVVSPNFKVTQESQLAR